MSGTITRIGAAGAGALLALGILAATPAGASGDHESKSEHARKSAHSTCLSSDGKTQGRSASDPDGMSNGGPDKPGCAGGFDADRDGNNGCGNDADREDDNNGHCGVNPVQARGEADDAKDADDGEKSTTTTATAVKTTEPETVSAKVEEDADEPTDCEVDAKEAEDCAKPAADDDTAPDSSNEPSSPLTQAGAGFGGMTILIVLARWLLRIG